MCITDHCVQVVILCADSAMQELCCIESLSDSHHTHTCTHVRTHTHTHTLTHTHTHELSYTPGTGVGATKWIVHLEGGGWCYNEDDCVSRSKTSLGSSKFWPENATFAGFLSDNKDVNPNFYTWNVAYVKYCDGASFAGEV